MRPTIEAPPLHTLAIAGRDERFPVNRVFCVGRNDAAHAREMGRDPDREPPFFFMKPAAAVVYATAPASAPYPPKTTNDHPEIELVVAIARGGCDIPVAQALDPVDGHAVGLDMTRRDLQLEASDKRRPREFRKSFALRRAEDIDHLSAAAITLTVNGQPRRSSDIAKLICSVSECRAYGSEYEALEPGDIAMTGTPEGVNAVVAGDLLRGEIPGPGPIEVRVTGDTP